MAVQPVGGISVPTNTAPINTPPANTARADAPQRAGPESSDPRTVISKVTRTDPDGSTVTTITYADGHTKVETTPPKYAAADGRSAAGGVATGGRVTAVDILA